MQRAPRRRSSFRPAGVAYVLVMLYLLLFTVLAIGFCAASTMSLQLARNDRSIADAQGSAESGLQFVRYQLSQLEIPPGTSDAELLPTLALLLGRQMNGSPNMGGHEVSVVGGMIHLPSEDSYIVLDPTAGACFQAHLATQGDTVWVKVVGKGRSSGIARAVQMKFKKAPSATGNLRDASRLSSLPDTYQEVSP